MPFMLPERVRSWSVGVSFALLWIVATASAAPRLYNLSSRARIAPGAELICGFVVRGNESKTLLVRAGGPSLAQFGIPSVLPNPAIDVRTPSNERVGYNDDWLPADADTMSALGAFPYLPGSKDAAFMATFAQGNFNAIVSDASLATGVCIVELYDGSPDAAELFNLSTRAKVGVNADILIQGFSVRGAGLLKVLVRAVGPGLGRWLDPAQLLGNPVLEIRSAKGALVALVDDWDNSDTALRLAGETVGAFALDNGSRDASALVDLPAGEYTAQVRGVDATTGIALAEVYSVSGRDDVPPLPVTSVSVTPATLRLGANQTDTATANVFPFNADTRTILWTSDHPNVAQVNSNGEILGVSAGEATVTATSVDGGKSAHVAVSVAANPAAATLDLFVDQPIYAARGGIGANVTAISTSIAVDLYGGKLGSAYCRLPEASDDAHWDTIFDSMNWSGLDWIRLLVEMNDYEPQKNTFTWDSPNFLRACKILAWAQAHHVDVLLQLQGHATTWNTLPGQDPAYSAPADLDAFANGFASMVDYLVNNQGFTCITMVNIANEPMNPWGWWRGGDVADGYRKTRAALDAKGLSVPLAGTEYFADRNFNFNWETCKPFLGVYENHNYADASENKIAFRPISDPAYPVYWGEFGGADNTYYPWLLTTAKWQLGGFSNGVDGFARWSYLNQNDIDGDFSYIRTWDTVKKSLLDTYALTPNLFHVQAMLSRYSAKASQVHAVATDNPALVPALLHSPNGAWTASVVNVASSQILDTVFWFRGLSAPVTLQRYTLTSSDLNRLDRFQAPSREVTLTPDAPWLQDRLAPNSITVYSTYKIDASAEGIVDDGAFAALAPARAIVSHDLVWDDADSHLTFSSGWTTATDSADHLGTSHYTRQPGATCTFTFTGTRFRLYGHQDNGSALATVKIDGEFRGYANHFAPLRLSQRVTFDSGPLAPGVHTVQIKNESKKTLTSLDTYLNIDAAGIEVD